MSEANKHLGAGLIFIAVGIGMIILALVQHALEFKYLIGVVALWILAIYLLQSSVRLRREK
ncbi:hypothetical protein HD599_003325 [Conyzicola lurida]|uniref:Uncharacterized protein n=1 Tax=Conyzicola lurida TaxID=1172621 RepID=A0A841AST4_9MICO|nr:hypothetical protein [Conyzicola lurida]MBB5845002.1 hypothetical protein [Conyzicola lurida]